VLVRPAAPLVLVRPVLVRLAAPLPPGRLAAPLLQPGCPLPPLLVRPAVRPE
jgi:hypothetical protein